MEIKTSEAAIRMHMINERKHREFNENNKENSAMGKERGMESWEMLLKKSQPRPEMKLSWEGVRSGDEEVWKTYRGSGKRKRKTASSRGKAYTKAWV